MSDAAERTNTMFGDLNIRESRVLFVHGSVDPWHALGITHTTTKNNVVIFINGKITLISLLIILLIITCRQNYNLNYLVMPTTNFDLRAFISTGTAHCANMYPAASTDLPELTQARTTIRAYLKEWLAESDYVDSAQYT